MSDDKSLWVRRPELILVWIVWAIGPGFWGANLLFGRLTRHDSDGLPDMEAAVGFLFCHFASAVGTLGMLLARGPQRRLPEFWILVAYWIPFVGFVWKLWLQDQRLVELFVRAAIVLIAAMPAAAVVRVLWRWSATIWRRSADRDGPAPHA